MKFFNKQGVAITITILMVVAAIAIGFFASAGKTEYDPDSAASAASWAKEHSSEYEKFIRDDVGLLSDSARQKLARVDAELDYTYASIVGVAVIRDLDGAEIGDAAYDYGYEIGCGESDLMLLIDAGTQDWYLAWGDDMAYYVNNELEVIFRSYMGEKVFSGSADRQLEALFTDLADWYEDTIPVADSHGETASAGSRIATVLLTVCIIIAVISLIVALCSRPRRRYYAAGPAGGSNGFWKGMFWGSLLGGNRGRRPPPPPPHNPPPPGGPGFGSGPNRSGGPSRSSSSRSGGFGGSSRGSGFGSGSRGGGFGGSSRGGSFGGRSGGSRGGGFGGGRR